MEKRLPWVSRSPCITVVNFLVVQERPPSLTSVVSDWSVKAGRPFHVVPAVRLEIQTQVSKCSGRYLVYMKSAGNCMGFLGWT